MTTIRPVNYVFVRSEDPIGARLRAIRHARGYSLQDVERESSGQFDAMVIGSWERGGRRPTVEGARALLEWYDYRLEIVAADEVVVRAPEVLALIASRGES